MIRRQSHLYSAWIRLQKNRVGLLGLSVCLLYFFIALFAPYLAPHSPIQQDLKKSFFPLSKEHWLGCDEFGRDILSRILYGARLSLLIQVSSVLLSLLVGVFLGLIGGYYGGKLDEMIMRFMDILLAFPGMLLALAIVSILGPNLQNLIVAIGIYSIPQFARITRGSVIAIKENEYVKAARAIGEKDKSIMMLYIVPNAMSPIIVQTTLRMSTVLLTAAGLGFLGLGAQPPAPEWGAMLSNARMYLSSAPTVALFPGFAIMLVVLGFNVFGDALQDALNPRLKE